MRREVIPARSLPRQRLQPDEVTTVSTDELSSWLVGIETDISRLEQNRVVVLSEFDSRDATTCTAAPQPSASSRRLVGYLVAGRNDWSVRHGRRLNMWQPWRRRGSASSLLTRPNNSSTSPTKYPTGMRRRSRSLPPLAEGVPPTDRSEGRVRSSHHGASMRSGSRTERISPSYLPASGRQGPSSRKREDSYAATTTPSPTNKTSPTDSNKTHKEQPATTGQTKP
jgi:hypothetical protein